MAGLRRLLGPLVVVLVLAQTGCASYKPAVIPNATESPPDGEAHVILEVGSTVRVVLKDESTIRGKIVSLSSTEIVLEQVEEFGSGTAVIEMDEIETIEREDSPALKSVLFGTVAVAVSAFLVLVAFAYAFLDTPIN